METTTQNSLFSFFIIATIAIATTDNVASQSRILQSAVAYLQQEEQLQGRDLHSKEPNGFPFEIKGSMFVRKSDGKPVFLNIICYQPLEPGKRVDSEIGDERVRDDLRRWRAYQGGTDPLILRVYPQPTPAYPMRMLPAFYDGVRELGFWIIRDIYFDQNFLNPNFIEKGHRAIDAVIAEVNDANALDLIFAWEIGNEFQYNETPGWNPDVIKQFIENMCSYLKTEIGKIEANNVSNWVTWASYPPYDPLFTDGNPLVPSCLDYIGYNIYSYHPERLRDHQAGPVTGTPYQGYLAALKKRYLDKPLVISETGLSDSVISHQNMLRPWYPIYRYGGMSPEQVAEGLADRYWGARLLRDDKDPNIVITGISIFGWNDEWWKGGTAGVDNQLPEEHFGLGQFRKRPNGDRYQLRYKLHQQTIRDLYSLTFDHNTTIIEDVIADNNSLLVGKSTLVHTLVSDSAAEPVRFRWETNRGYIIGDSNIVKFYSGNNALGPAKITVVAIDANSNASVASILINIETPDPNRIEIFTLGRYKASGCVYNVNLDEYKLIVYIKTNKFYAQPYQDQHSPTGVGMKSIWINKQGYWWTKVFNDYNGELYCWLVPKGFHPDDEEVLGWTPNGSIAFAKMVNINDADNDLLPNNWEEQYFGSASRYNRYDDPDGDMGNNLEEFLRKMDPNDPDDNDTDGLLDNWECHYFGDINLFDANDDPDSDGLTNLQEQDLNLGTHPSRASQDKDQDGLPDLWEIRWFGNCDANAHDNSDGDCLDNLDEYELSSDPTISTGDFNCDSTVDFYDLYIFQLAWLSDPNEANWNPACDIFEPGDNLINFLDFTVLGKNWLLGL
ncbi:MAG: hypothetical protein ACFFCW_08610 [Candidatus Hodarchaeota archaeon]